MKLTKPHHWICKDCETANHNTRDKCLSCGEPISQVKAVDKEYERLAKKLGLMFDSTIGMTLSEKQISNFNNGEYP